MSTIQRQYKYVSHAKAASVLRDVVRDQHMIAVVTDYIPRPGEAILRLPSQVREILKTLKSDDIQNVRIDYVPNADLIHRRRAHHGERYWQTSEEEFQKLLNK